MELIESYGTGIKKIMQSYLKTQYKPKFKITSGGFLLVLPNRNHIADISADDDDSRFSSVINILKENKSLSRREIQNHLNIKQTTCLNILSELEKAKKNKKIGNGKNIKYVLRHS